MRPLLLCLAACSAAAQGTGSGSIVVTVLDQVSHEPVKKADVMLSGGPAIAVAEGSGPLQYAHAGTVQGPQHGRTDASGTVTFNGLGAGMYFAQVHHPLYVGQVSARSMPHQQVNLAAGKSESVKFELQPGGAISGRIVDEDGDPVGNCYVQVRAPAPPGRPSGAMYQGDASNDDGEYRAFGIPAGKYYVIAQCAIPPLMPRPLLPVNTPWTPTEAYARQYYPNSTSTKGAELVEVAAGAERSGLDFQMTRVPVTTVRGVIRCPDDGWRAGQINVNLVPRDSAASAENVRGGGVNNNTGTFEIPMVEPGSYTLMAYSWGNDNTKVYGGRAQVEVMPGRRPDPLVLDLNPAQDLPGTVEFESGAPEHEGQMVVQMYQADPIGIPPPQVKMNRDGTFLAAGVLPGIWNVNVWAGPQAYVKSIWLGDREAKGGRLDTTSGTGALRIVLGTKGGTVTGRVDGTAQHVALVSAEEGVMMMRGPLYGTMTPDGRFTFANVPPGKYRVFALPAMADLGELMQDPNVEATEITVEEGGSVTVTVKPVAKASV